MGDIIDAAALILKSTEKRLESISNNIANISTPGFKRSISISHVGPIANRSDGPDPLHLLGFDSSSGTLKQTGNPFDMAISGSGYFLVREDDQFYLTRAGRFTRGEDGTLRDTDGRILQLAGGGDVVADGERVEIRADGTLISDGAPLGTVGVYVEPNDNGPGGPANRLPINGVPVEAEDGEYEIRQGMLESSNVILSDEMVSLMANVRQAEGAAQLARFYDQLVGQAITTFAKAGR